MPQNKPQPEITETKEELKAEIARLHAVIADLQEQLASRDAVARSSSEPGWLFITRNPNFSGERYGVRFAGGRGFLPKSTKDAERTMRRMVSDFGYEVREISAAEFEKLPARKAENNEERGFLEKVAPAKVMQ